MWIQRQDSYLTNTNCAELKPSQLWNWRDQVLAGLFLCSVSDQNAPVYRRRCRGAQLLPQPRADRKWRSSKTFPKKHQQAGADNHWLFVCVSEAGLAGPALIMCVYVCVGVQRRRIHADTCKRIGLSALHCSCVLPDERVNLTQAQISAAAQTVQHALATELIGSIPR